MQQEDGKRKPLIRPVQRDQLCWRPVDVEQLIGGDHPARAIWEVVGRLDLSGYYDAIECDAERGGRPATDPRLLISLWVYAYSEGIGAAREVSRRCEWDPAFQWLTGCEVINYHTLADFRVQQRSVLDKLFTQLLGMLSAEGLITLAQVTQDGTKIKALAAGKSFRRKQRIQQHLELARQQVAALSDPNAEAPNQRMEQARRRAARERQARLEQTLTEVQALPAQGRKPEEELRVSTSDPQARQMKQADGGYAPSYNVQIATDAAHGLIVDVAVVQAGNDAEQLAPAVERVQQRMQALPQQMLADGGYTNFPSVQAMAQRGVDFLGAWRDIVPTADGPPFRYEEAQDCYVCPQGKFLHRMGRQTSRSGMVSIEYQARWQDCQSCPLKPKCCPRNRVQGRGVLRDEENSVVQVFREKMATVEAQLQYRRRAPVAEFCNAWIKSKLGLRQFHVRGLLKVGMESLWACFTYNLQQWIRLTRLAAAPMAS